MKHKLIPIIIIILLPIILFTTCKKKELKIHNLVISSETVIKGRTFVQITADYTYPTTLKSVIGYVSLTSDMTVANKYTATVTDNTFVVNFNNLQANTTYYYSFEYSNGIDVVMTDLKSFTTPPLSPAGAINGLFSISATRQVWFSQGNLQYQASTNTWRFADYQYDYIGSDNSNISSSYIGWIDLFGWGTGNNPTNSSTYDGNYASFNDWGNNAILYSGNIENKWRTLKKNEWVYVFNNRNTTNGTRYAKATVNGVNGVILLPDDWSSSYYSLSITDNREASYSSNTISLRDWTSKFEANGAVFLPAAGYRERMSVYGVGSSGKYWSNTSYGSGDAYYAWIDDSFLSPDIYNDRHYGTSVRLVCNAE